MGQITRHHHAVVHPDGAVSRGWFATPHPPIDASGDAEPRLRTCRCRAAWFANSPEGQAIIAGSGWTVPSLIEVAVSAAFLDPAAKPADSQVFLATIPVLRGVPSMAGWVDVEELTGDELERAFYGQASADEVIDAMITRTLPFFAGEEG